MEAGLYLKLEKCEFYKETIKYLGFNILTKGISRNAEKVSTVRNCSQPKTTANGRFNNLLEVKQFLGFFDYYRRFIQDYSKKAEPPTRLIKKGETVLWLEDQQLAFEGIVESFRKGPILRCLDH